VFGGENVMIHSKSSEMKYFGCCKENLLVVVTGAYEKKSARYWGGW
jgi:hypothetical protein